VYPKQTQGIRYTETYGWNADRNMW